MLQESWNILSVTHDEKAFSEGVSSFWRTCLFSCNLKPLFKRNEDISSCLRDKILSDFWSHFGSLGQEFLRSAILNEEKALGTRLPLTATDTLHNLRGLARTLWMSTVRLPVRRLSKSKSLISRQFLSTPAVSYSPLTQTLCVILNCEGLHHFLFHPQFTYYIYLLSFASPPTRSLRIRK